MAVVSPAAPSTPSAGRSAGVRLLALLLGLLALAVQPRAFAAGLPLTSSGPHIAAHHAPRAESHALRVEGALRVASSPVLGRVPCAPPEWVTPRWRTPCRAAVGPSSARALRGERLSHFHSLRRIPRMNSDEPRRS
ncbi:MAG: hypothetical protein ABI627_23140 [Polyangiaceae bacterium]